jgi:hypothetical protein
MESTHPPIQKRRKTNVWVVVDLSALALIAIAGVVLFFVLKSVVGSYTDTYASTEIRVFPVPTMTAEDARPLLDDFKAFKTAIENRETPDAFSPTGDEINALLQYDEELDTLVGIAYVEILDDQLYADVSVPLGMITVMLEGQYLNGSSLIHIEMQNGQLHISSDQLEVKG